MAVNPAIGFAAHPYIFIVDAHNDIARSDTGLPSRHVQVRRLEGTAVTALVIANGRANAGVLSRGDESQFVGASRFVELRVRIQAVQHIINGLFHLLLRIQRVDIVEIEIAIQGIEDVERLGGLKVMRLLWLLRTE